MLHFFTDDPDKAVSCDVGHYIVWTPVVDTNIWFDKYIDMY